MPPRPAATAPAPDPAPVPEPDSATLAAPVPEPDSAAVPANPAAAAVVAPDPVPADRLATTDATVALVFGDGTVLELPSDDDRVRAFRRAADSLLIRSEA